MAEAFELIFSFDKELYGIIGRTLILTFASTLIATVIGVLLGILLGSRTFRGKRIVMRVVNTLMGLPPVVAGLIVYLLLSRNGPLGFLSLMYSMSAMIVAQVLLITPIITGLVSAAIQEKTTEINETCIGINIDRKRRMRLLLAECKGPVLAAILAGYGRANSEVGAIMMVGGNIQHKTRVMTTTIMMETNMGNFGVSIALGIILLVIAFVTNWLVQRLQGAAR